MTSSSSYLSFSFIFTSHFPKSLKLSSFSLSYAYSKSHSLSFFNSFSSLISQTLHFLLLPILCYTSQFLMAERKLNFNVPLLSTRRMHNTAVSVRRNKTHNFTDDDDHSKTTNSPSVPVLASEIGLDHVTEPGSVPFTWELAPGRLKGFDFRPTTQELFTPCLPPGKVKDMLKCPKDGNLTRVQSLKDKEAEESEDEGDVFSDARDTLTPNDSFSVNQSIYGVSENGVVEKKKPKKLSEDPQSRDFMLNRFLPAAKAMTVEHYASNRKPASFMPEPTLQVRELVPEEKRHTTDRYDESITPSYYDHQDINGEESEKDDVEDDEASEYSYLSKRGCGLLPQLCFKDSLSMLNTVPGFKTSPSHDQVKSSKVAQLKSRFQSVKKLALETVSKQKLGGKVQSPLHPSISKKFNSESNLSVASRSSSPYRNTRSMSPFRSTGNSSPFHPACFPETRKETDNLRANRLNKHIRNISTSQELLGSTSSFLEKTVYVDTENSPMTENVIISPEEEADNAGKQPNANLELEAFESVSTRSSKMMNGNELGMISNVPDRSRLAPPSPKKPSESWLLHNLPSVTSQIPSRRYSFHPQKQALSENSRNVTKWETIVKTSYMHRDHIRYSEELVAHTSHSHQF